MLAGGYVAWDLWGAMISPKDNVSHAGHLGGFITPNYIITSQEQSLHLHFGLLNTQEELDVGKIRVTKDKEWILIFVHRQILLRITLYSVVSSNCFYLVCIT